MHSGPDGMPGGGDGGQGGLLHPPSHTHRPGYGHGGGPGSRDSLLGLLQVIILGSI